MPVGYYGLARDQEAQVATDEANARKAAADADTSALTLAQTRYKSLVPDLTGVATNAVDDKSTGVVFSGLVTYSALNHAAEIISSRISDVLASPAEGHLMTILVTSQSDLLTDDLLSSTVASSLRQLIDFADEVLAEPGEPRAGALQPRVTGVDLEMLTRAATASLAGGVGTAAGAAGVAAAAAGLGPIGLGAADLELARAQQEQDAATKAQPPPSGDDAGLADRVATAEAASGNAAAALSIISAAITSIVAFTTAVNATAAGTRSPLAVASLNEPLHTDGGDGIGYVLLVKGLGGQSEEYTKDRHVGFDTYTTLADASVAFMFYDVTARKIISSGVANGVSSVHGRLGHPPTGLVGPDAEDAIGDQAADIAPAENQPDQPDGQHQRWWRRRF